MIRPSKVTHVTRPMHPIKRVTSRAASRERLRKIIRIHDRQTKRGVTHVTRPRVLTDRRFRRTHASDLYNRRFRLWRDMYRHVQEQYAQRVVEQVNDAMLREHWDIQNRGLKDLLGTLEKPLEPGSYGVLSVPDDEKLVLRFDTHPHIPVVPRNQADRAAQGVPPTDQAVVRLNDPAEVPSSENSLPLDLAIDASPSDPDYFLKGGQ